MTFVLKQYSILQCCWFESLFEIVCVGVACLISASRFSVVQELSTGSMLRITIPEVATSELGKKNIKNFIRVQLKKGSYIHLGWHEVE